MENLEMRPPRAEEIEKLKLLWQTAFSDDAAYIDFFFRHISAVDMALCAFDGETLAGMLFLLPAVLWLNDSGFEARYVYGVATDPQYRGQGVMTRLESAACDLCKKQGVRAMVLIPAEKFLFGMYQKLGYRTRLYACETALPRVLSPQAKISSCSKEWFIARRRALLQKKASYVDLYPKLWEYRFDELTFSGAAFRRAETEGTEGYLVCCRQEDCLRILETDLSGKALSHAAGALAAEYGCSRIVLCGENGSRRPYGMVKPLSPLLCDAKLRTADCYMNLMMSE